MEVEVDEKDLKACRSGNVLRWTAWITHIWSGDRVLQAFHSRLSRPPTVGGKASHITTFRRWFLGNSCLFIKHVKSGIKIHFNAFDALTGWMQEALPPVEAPAAAKWEIS